MSTSNTTLAIQYSDIEQAAQRILGLAHKTPVLTSTIANELSGAQLFFKCENFQRMGAFKFRGAANAIAKFSPAQRKGGVIAFSSGNHAQAIALSARMAGIPALIVMPKDAPNIKLQATRGYGAEIVLYDRYTQDREALCKQLAAERGMTMIPPFDHADVMAGQGTASKELFEEVGTLDALIVCLGGGGLLSGCAIAAHHFAPQCEVIGAEPEAGDDAKQSLAAGHIIKIDTPKTIADGAQTQALGLLTFPVIQQHVSRIETVSDTELKNTMRFFAQTMKMVVEPTGCLAAAVAMRQNSGLGLKGKRVGIIVSGGNTDLSQFGQFLNESTI
jgi:threo-3-hydroxy-L-aspartate ammonia-lyase